MPWAPKTEAELRALFATQRWPDRSSIRTEYDAAIRYMDGDMQANTEALLSQRYSATMRDPDTGNRIEAVTVALVQQYVDEMATAYSGTVERRVVGPDGEPDPKRTDIVLREMERTGFDQLMAALDRRVVALRSCAQVPGVEVGHVAPVIYPPQDVYPVTIPGYDPANQDACAGYVVDRRLSGETGGDRSFAYVEAEGVTMYAGPSAEQVTRTTGGKANALLWPQPDLSDERPTNTTSVRPINPLIVWHATRPVGELVPLGSCALFRGNRWLNVMWSIVLDVVRFQAGALLMRFTHDTSTLQQYQAVGVRHPLGLRKEEEDARYETAGNDYAGVTGVLQTFAKTLGMTLRLSPDDFSLERTAESGYARQIANIPKDRARADRIKWYSLMEAEYLWPRYAAAMIWLGKLDEGARQCRLQTTLRPLPLPVNQLERIQIEDHDIRLGLTTPARIFAERNKVSEDQARESLRAMREAEVEDRKATEEAPAPLAMDAPKATALAGLVGMAAKDEIPADSAETMVQLVYGLSPEDAARLIDPIRAKQAEPKPEAPQVQAPQAPQAPQPTGDEKRRVRLEALATAKPRGGGGAESD